MSFFDSFKDWALTWLPLVFFGLLVYLVWRTLASCRGSSRRTIDPASKSSVTWDDVAGVDEVREELQEVVEFLRDPKSLRAARRARPEGHPPLRPARHRGRRCSPRPSRTSPARASTPRARRRSSRCSPGSAPARIRKLFDTARKNQPAIVFIDELDAVGMRRSGHSFNREHDQTLNQLLVELDGFEDAGQVVVIGASNRLEDLDPALLRPGSLRSPDPRLAARPGGSGGDPRACTRAASRSAPDVDL